MAQNNQGTPSTFLKYGIRAAFSALACWGLIGAAAAAPPVSPTPVERWWHVADTVFKNFVGDNGPPAGAGLIAEDGDGFLWVGGQGGLARWDGYRFRKYLPDPKNASSLPDGYIHHLYTDRHGRLWVGTLNGGLARYDRERDGFIRIPVGPAGTAHPQINAVVDDDVGGVWIATPAGLDHFNVASGAMEHLRHDPGDPGSLPSDRVRSLLSDRSGTLWVTTNMGLVRRAGSTKGNSGFVPVPLPNGVKEDLTRLFQASDGRIWIGTGRHGAMVLDPATNSISPVQETGAAQSPLPSIAFAEPRAGEIWISTNGQGILAVDVRTLQTKRIRHDPRVPTSLVDDLIGGLLRDRSGLLWVAAASGLGRYDPQSAVLSVNGASGHIGGVSEASVLSVLSARDENIMLGLRNNGVAMVDPAGAPGVSINSDATSAKPDSFRTSLANQSVYSLASDATGAVYVGTQTGVFRANHLSEPAVRLEFLPGKAELPVMALLPDANRLWIGRQDGVWMLDLNAPAAHPVRPEGLEKLNGVLALAPAEAGRLWIGTVGGLGLYNPASHEVERIQGNPSDPQSLPARYISALLSDRQHRLWVGTDDGVYLMEGRSADGKPRFRHFGKTEGLFDGGVAKLLEDGNGDIWANNDSEIFQINGKTLVVRNVRSSEGIGPYLDGAGAVSGKGELLFGGLGGLTVVRPQRYREWAYRPPIVVTDVRIGGKAIPAFYLNAESRANAKPLTITPDANSIAVEFAALDYSAPEKNRYAYRLDGYDKDWIDTDATRRLASYTNLPPGDYRLRLRGSNRNGAWSERELILPVQVQPAWYQTWWMRLVEALAAAAAIYAFVQGRTRYLKRRQRELENQVSERTGELAHANALLEENQSELTRFLAVASHDLRQPMHALNLYLGALSGLEMSPAARPVLGHVRQCAQIMDDMFLALLDLSRLDAQIVTPHIDCFPVAALLSSIEVEYAPQTAAKGLRLRVAGCSAWVKSDRALVEQILRNLVANAVRYTESGSILVGCRRRGDTLRLAVFDTGIGISPDQQKTVFEEFCQLGNASRDRTKGLGLGLAIVRRLARLLDTPITLVSTPGRGSMFAVDLPLAAQPATAELPNNAPVRENGLASMSGALAGKTVVVIDDEESILDAMHILLAQWGCNVVTAVSAAEAIVKLGDCAQVPDVLICDYWLRARETGTDAISALQGEFNCDIPALIITGTATRDRMQELAGSGLPVLHKPVNAAALYEALVQLVSSVPA